MSATNVSVSDLVKAKSILQAKIAEQKKFNRRLQEIAVAQWSQDKDEDEDAEEDDLASSVPFVLSRLPSVAPAAVTSDLATQSLDRLTLRVHAWKVEKVRSKVQEITGNYD